MSRRGHRTSKHGTLDRPPIFCTMLVDQRVVLAPPPRLAQKTEWNAACDELGICRDRATLGRSRPKQVHPGANLARASSFICSAWAEFGPNLANSAPDSADSLTHSGPRSARRGNFGPMSFRLAPDLADGGPHLSRLGRRSARRPSISIGGGPICRFGPESAKPKRSAPWSAIMAGTTRRGSMQRAFVSRVSVVSLRSPGAARTWDAHR